MVEVVSGMATIAINEWAGSARAAPKIL